MNASRFTPKVSKLTQSHTLKGVGFAVKVPEESSPNANGALSTSGHPAPPTPTELIRACIRPPLTASIFPNHRGAAASLETQWKKKGFLLNPSWSWVEGGLSRIIATGTYLQRCSYENIEVQVT